VQEHRLDALQIKEILKQLGLSFEGFNIAPQCSRLPGNIS
jgi:hypothetical protein